MCEEIRGNRLEIGRLSARLGPRKNPQRIDQAVHSARHIVKHGPGLVTGFYVPIEQALEISFENSYRGTKLVRYLVERFHPPPVRGVEGYGQGIEGGG
jgi:hypothetical protein